MPAEQENRPNHAHVFYKKALELLQESGIRFMLGGGFAMLHYTGIYRDTKDLDVFCEAEECPRILELFDGHGYCTELTDIRWLAKIFDGDLFIDIIFNTPNNICKVDESWFQHAVSAEVMGVEVLMISAEEIIWCKTYVQNRDRYDGADVNHLILKQGKNLDWKRLLSRLDQHWHLLLAAILLFQFVYPADHGEIVPRWLFDELLERARRQYEFPVVRPSCLGPLLDQRQYDMDVKEWNYKVSTI